MTPQAAERAFVASREEAGCRLDVCVVRRLPELSRSRVQGLIEQGCITLDGNAVRSHVKVRTGMAIRVVVPPPEEAEPAAEAILLQVLYEDRDVIVIDKPAGLVVHPAAGHASGTLVNALLYHCADLAGIGGQKRPGIVHRLDKDTSGVMVAVKNEAAMQSLVAQFKAGQVIKEYVALVHGCPQPPSGRIETLIGRSPNDRKKMSARPARGRRAVTCYVTEEALGAFCLLRVRIETGRTHQIRVHMAHIGHPVVGDLQYGRRRQEAAGVVAGRQMLHAFRLTFHHPSTGRIVVYEAPFPPDLVLLLDVLRGRCAGAGADLPHVG